MPAPNNRFAFSTIPLPGHSSLPFTPHVRGQRSEPNGEQIVHIKLTLFQNRDQNIIFCALPVRTSAKADDIEAYVSKLMQRRTGRLKGSRGDGAGTPFDIVLDRQCVVVVELDSKINWRFSPGSWGVSTAAFYGDPGASHDFGPRFVTEQGITPAQDEATVPILPKGKDKQLHECQILFFKSAQRRRNMAQKFNFHIDFHQPSVLRDKSGAVILDKDGKPTFSSKILPMIFDPDVGNNGGVIYPP